MAGTSSNDIEMNPALYYTDTLSLICNVLAHERSSLHEAFEGIVGQIILVLVLDKIMNHSSPLQYTRILSLNSYLLDTIT
jgi:hypothetical protein